MATADPLWADLDSLPPLAAYPGAHAVPATQETVVAAAGDAGHHAAFRCVTDREVVGVLEVETDAPLDAEAQRMVGSILRIYRNFQGAARLQRARHADRPAQPQDLRRELPARPAQQVPAGQAPGRGAARGRAASQRRYWLGVIDIDHFKRVNDNYGHLIGDEVLLLLSRLMRSSFRFHDRLYRFGGEEFVVLMRCASDGDAALALERLREHEAYPFPQVGRITVSIGFTERARRRHARAPPSSAPTRRSTSPRPTAATRWPSHAELVKRGELTELHKVGDVELF